ncbi:MAG: exodeoxyribonuclease III [Bdellovibrionaceae bacterium]|nr:exodeoxyribonuclease III [Bdellovibrio sp.]
MKTIKLVTWNVNGIRASFDKGLGQLVRDVKPDIICLQETKAHKEQVNPELQSLGYAHHFWSSAERKGYSGVATFLHEAPKRTQTSIDHPQYEKEGRIVWTQHADFDLYNIYFPNGGSGELRHQFKQTFLKDLTSHLKFEMKKGKQIIVVGDYNVAHQAIDIYDPVMMSRVSGFLPEERQWFTEFLNSGFVDCYRYLNPTKKNIYSWWSYKEMARIKNRGWRIDYICATSGLIKHLKKCEVLMEQLGSDHCPVMAEFQFE